jgi:hypothetical protein
VTFGTGRSAFASLPSDQHHEQDIRFVVQQQETKGNTAGRNRSGMYDFPRKHVCVFIGAS